MKSSTQSVTIAPELETNSSSPSLVGKWLRAARIGWVVLAILAVCILMASLPGYATKFQGQLAHVTGNETPPGAQFFAAASGVASLASALLSIGLATLLFRNKFSEPMTALVSYFLLIYGISMAGPLEHVSVILPGFLKYAQTIQGLLLATPLIALLMLFPSGKFFPRWTRWIVLLSIPWNIGLIIVAPFDAKSIQQNPLIAAIVTILFIAFSLIGVYAQIYRYRRVSNPAERQQTRWVVYGFALWIAYMFVSTIPYMYLTSLPPSAPTPWWGPASELGWWLSLNILPVCLTIAITRSRLWSIDLVINRTLVYGTLTVATIALYVLVVGTLGNLLHLGNSSFIAFLTTGLVAVLFQPLRERLQGWVNRWMYGERDDPVAVLSRLGETLERTGSPEDALQRIAETVARTLKLPYAAIQLGDEVHPVAEFGIPRPEIKRFSLVYQNETSGFLVVAPRSTGESFSSSDLRLLENIAHQAGAAAHAAKLTADLRLSRQKLITAREEERRRIRRDLHDGLGPTLASLTLRLDAARNLLDTDPEEAARLLAELKKQTQTTIQDVRTLVYELRPPALDELGLLGALQNFIGQHTAQSPQICLEVSTPLPPLPAAAEVAVYRIVMEAINNALRHAKARKVIVEIRAESKNLMVEVRDDGIGLAPEAIAGVGLASMRERAEELGGHFAILPNSRGLHLQAVLPLVKE